MFEEKNMDFMNPHDNEIMQRNYAKMQKKIVFWMQRNKTKATQPNKIQ